MADLLPDTLRVFVSKKGSYGYLISISYHVDYVWNPSSPEGLLEKYVILTP
jgi:hypothetical protein